MDVPRQKVRSRKRWVFGGAGIVALVLSAVGLSRLEPAAPTVEKGPLWTDTVRRGDMVRQVKGPGTLVAEEIHWIPAVTPGRIERKLVEPGSTVAEGTIIVELSNPDAERQELEARRQLTASEAELANLRSTLENQRLTQEGTVATVTSEFREATRQVRTTEALARQNMAAPQELEKARDRVGELQTRLDVERKRLGFMTTSMRTQISAQQAQVAMLRSLAAFQLRQMDAMHVRAGTAGVLQELPVEMGQWVNSGATLAKVVQPGRLKAVLRIPETQAKDVAVGQPASIDTRNGIVKGHVVRIDPSVQNGTVTVDVALEGTLPQGARPDLSVDGTVDIERLHDVLYVGRPAYGQPESVVGLFKLSPSGDEATRTNVRLGRGSASTIEVTAGLKQGDIVIISDMSNWDSANRLRLK